MKPRKIIITIEALSDIPLRQFTKAEMYYIVSKWHLSLTFVLPATGRKYLAQRRSLFDGDVLDIHQVKVQAVRQAE